MKLSPNDSKRTSSPSVTIAANSKSYVWSTGNTKNKESSYFPNEISPKNRMNRFRTLLIKTKTLTISIAAFYSESWQLMRIYGLTYQAHNLSQEEDLPTKKSKGKSWNIQKIKWSEGQSNPLNTSRKQLKDKAKCSSSSIKIKLNTSN